jgi:hypothetical protein
MDEDFIKKLPNIFEIIDDPGSSGIGISMTINLTCMCRSVFPAKK